MAQAYNTLERFKSEILGGAGLSRNNRFEVDIAMPRALGGRNDDLKLTNLYVESSSMPLLNVVSKPFKIFGPAYQRPYTSEYGGEGMQMTFHVDRSMRIRRFFEDWMHAIVNPNNFFVSYQADYAVDIVVRQIDEQNNITHEIRLYEAYPRNMNIMELNHAASSQTHRLNMLFAYRYWRRTDQPTEVYVPRILNEPQVPTIDYTIQRQGQFSWTGTNVGDYVNDGGDSYFPPSA